MNKIKYILEIQSIYSAYFTEIEFNSADPVASEAGKVFAKVLGVLDDSGQLRSDIMSILVRLEDGSVVYI